MKILFLENSMHQKNLNALYKYNNNYYVIKSVEQINNIDLRQFDCVYSPCIPLNVKKYPNTKFIFGPHFSVFPQLHQMNEIRNNNSIYIQDKFVKKVLEQYKNPNVSELNKILLINAWNEWGEKMNIEPSNEKNDLYLSVIKNNLIKMFEY